MVADEFFIAVAEADFIKIVGSGNIFSFYEYVSRNEKQDKIIIRLLKERENPDGVPRPFYLWLVYSKQEDSVEMIFPDFEYPLSQMDMPEEIQGLDFFAVELHDRRE